MQIDKYQRDVYIVLTHIIGSQYTFTYTFLFVPVLNLSLNTLRLYLSGVREGERGWSDRVPPPPPFSLSFSLSLVYFS